MYDFTGIGNPCLDLIAFVDDDVLTHLSLDKSHQIIIDKEKKNELLSFFPSIAYNLGGAASNVAHIISELGGKSAFMGRLADDMGGRTILKGLKESNIDYPLSPISNSSEDTSQIFCLTTLDAERTFASYYGIGTEMGLNDIHMETLQKSRLIYLDGYALYSPHMKDTFETILNEIDQENYLSIFHCGDISVIRDFPQAVQTLLKRTNIVIFNEEEALTCFPRTNILDIVKYLAPIKKAGAITLGKNGAYIFKDGEITKVNVTNHSLAPIDTCGAGDHFSGGFLYGILHDFSLEQCGHLASLCANDALLHFGARPQQSLSHLIALTNTHLKSHE